LIRIADGASTLLALRFHPAISAATQVEGEPPSELGSRARKFRRNRRRGLTWRGNRRTRG
jgi:hypothetical protein